MCLLKGLLAPMAFAMVGLTKRHGESIACFLPHAPMRSSVDVRDLDRHLGAAGDTALVLAHPIAVCG